MPQQFDVNSPTGVSNVPDPERSMRRSLLGLYESGKFMYRFTLQKQIDNFLWMIEYTLAVWPRRKRTPMDVEKMLADWREAVAQITLAHDKKTVDEWEAKLNDLLEPFLKAPVGSDSF